MSFKFKGILITLENYREIFKICTPDILDEIRSAILDDTQISYYIEKCGNDNYKLGQIRMALREMVPVEYLNTNMTGKTINIIRKCVKKGIDIEPLLKYIKDKELIIDNDVFETLAEFVYIGTDISKVDFTQISSKFVKLICKGLHKGFPMWLIIDPEVNLTENKIRTLMRGLQLGIDVHPFIYDNWTDNQMYLIFSYANSININEFLGYVNSKFEVEILKVLLDLYSKKLPITQLCVRDVDGFPLYNSYQLIELGSALEDGSLTDEMLNPKLSDMEINELHYSNKI